MNDNQQMKVLEDVYPLVYDFQELYLSYLEARKHKRFRGDVMKYSANLEANLIEIQNELIWETYEVGPYRPFYVQEPKTRLVMALQFKDRVVQWSIYRQLMPFYDKMFIEDSYACRKGKGSHAAMSKLHYWLRQVERKPGTWYYLKLDISKYFYRVCHEILLEILRERIKDERLIKLLEGIINSEDTKFGLPVGYSPDNCPEELWLDDVGMPIGNLTSQLFANIYLNVLDHFCKHVLKTRYYVRYMDDVIILSDDKKHLHEIKEEIEIFLRERLRLDLNKKTTIRPVSNGIEFVGYRIWATHIKVKKQTARRIIRRVKFLSKGVREGKVTEERFRRSAASYKGLLKHCNSFGLRRKLNLIYVREKNGDGEERGAGKP